MVSKTWASKALVSKALVSKAWASKGRACRPTLRVVMALVIALVAPSQILPAFADDLQIDVRPLFSFDPGVPNQHAFGPLTFLGGLMLSSNNRTFEALSGLEILDDTSLIMVTDEGHWVTATLESDADGRPLGLRAARIGPLVGTDGAPLETKRLADAEAVTLVGENLWVGFERNQPIRAYTLEEGQMVGPATLPLGNSEPLSAGRNEGVEALVHISEGPLAGHTVLFLEEARWQGANAGALPSAAHIGPDGALTTFAIRRMDDFAITGAAMMPGGAIVLVERFFSWSQGIAMRLRVVEASDILAGAAAGTVLVEARGDTVIDNMEGIAVTDHPGGPIITLISDDNGSFLQSTVLLRFQLTGGLESLPSAPPSPTPPLAMPVSRPAQ